MIKGYVTCIAKAEKVLSDQVVHNYVGRHRVDWNRTKRYNRREGKFAVTCNMPIHLIQITLDSFGSVRLPQVEIVYITLYTFQTDKTMFITEFMVD